MVAAPILNFKVQVRQWLKPDAKTEIALSDGLQLTYLDFYYFWTAPRYDNTIGWYSIVFVGLNSSSGLQGLSFNASCAPGRFTPSTRPHDSPISPTGEPCQHITDVLFLSRSPGLPKTECHLPPTTIDGSRPQLDCPVTHLGCARGNNSAWKPLSPVSYLQDGAHKFQCGLRQPWWLLSRIVWT